MGMEKEEKKQNRIILCERQLCWNLPTAFSILELPFCSQVPCKRCWKP